MIRIRRIAPDATAHSISIGPHSLITDMPASNGGGDEGPDPHDLYDAALGACKALTILWYAQRKGIAVGALEVAITRDASAEKQGTYRLVADISIGGDISDATREELRAVADRCPVHRLMTQVTTVIETRLTPNS